MWVGQEIQAVLWQGHSPLDRCPTKPITSLALSLNGIIIPYPRWHPMEDKMAILKNLTFTTLPTTGGNPILDRRTKIVARLEEQKLILKDPNYTRTVRNWV